MIVTLDIIVAYQNILHKDGNESLGEALNERIDMSFPKGNLQINLRITIVLIFLMECSQSNL